MQLQQLKSNFKRKSVKRVGRGGKRGTFSGRGTKGQKARAGHSIRPAERDIISKFPKLRGVKDTNKPKPKKVELSLSALQGMKETTITKQVLKKKGLLRTMQEEAKVLATGSISRAVTLIGITASASAKKKIEDAGGTVKGVK